MDQTQINQIADAVMQRLSGGKTPGSGRGTAVARPKELDDAGTDPTLRAAILENYTARLMEQPASSWSETEKAALWEQSRKVLATL
jgi:hypothetical protein